MFRHPRPHVPENTRPRKAAYPQRPTPAAAAVPPRRATRQRRRPRRFRRLRTLALVLVAIVLARALAGSLLTPHSTPREDWRAGEMPELYQTDPTWASEPYSGETIAKQGCGPASLAMAYIRLTGNTDLGVPEMANWATNHGYATDGNGSYWSLMDKGARQLGLSSRELGKPTAQALADELNAGRPVICIMGPGAFTSTGHFIALERTSEDGSIVIRDPNSPRNTHKTWDAELIATEAKAAWSLSLG